MGERSRKARKAAGLTQEKLSEMIDVSHQYISDFERGLVGAAAPTVVKLSRALNVSTDYLLIGEKECEDDARELFGRLAFLKPEEIALVKRAVGFVLEIINSNKK